MRVITAKIMVAKTLQGLALGLVLTLAVPVFSALVPGQTLLSGGVAQAQLIRPGNPEPETRRIPGMRERTNNQLAEATDYLQPPNDEETGEPVAEPNPDAAMRVLSEMEQEIEEFNAFERAQIYRLMAYAYHMKDDVRRAIDYFERVIAQSPEISTRLETDTLFTLGQLYASQENYARSMEIVRRWAAMVNDINADQYYFMGQMFYAQGDMNNALLHVNEAIRMHEEADRVPRENWLVTQRALYYEREDYTNTAVSLEKLVRHYPKHEYWRQLSSIYALLERPDDQMHAMEANYLQGGLTRERDLMDLARHFMANEVPYKAAKIVSKGIYEDEIIEPTADNLEFLANAWRQAEEIERSLVELERAAEESDDGELYARLAALYALNGQPEEAVEAGEQAIRSGGLSRPDQTYIVIAMAHNELYNFDEAIEALEKAAEDERSEEAVESRIAYIESERARYERARAEGIL